MSDKQTKSSYEDQILRLQAENAALKIEVKDLETRIGNASVILFDWDGFFNEEKLTGNAPELALLIEDAYTNLQGRSWLEPSLRERGSVQDARRLPDLPDE
jgi:hypothetical protein